MDNEIQIKTGACCPDPLTHTLERRSQERLFVCLKIGDGR